MIAEIGKLQEPCTGFTLCVAVDTSIIGCIYMAIFIGCPTFAPLLRVFEKKVASASDTSASLHRHVLKLSRCGDEVEASLRLTMLLTFV